MMIAVTGGMGSGKSTVSKILAKRLNAKLVNSDDICRQQLQPGQEGMNSLVDIYGDRFLLQDGQLDRNKLRSAVFTEQVIKSTIENILHPIVARTIKEAYDNLSIQEKRIVAEIPLLYETGMDTEFPVTIVARVSREISLQRVLKRDQLPERDINKIIDSQIGIDQKAKKADHIIDNSGTLASTYLQISWLCTHLSNPFK